MERNLDRRVEVLCPIRDVELRTHLREVVLDALLTDTHRAWSSQTDGSYVRALPADGERAAQLAAVPARLLHPAVIGVVGTSGTGPR